MSPRNASAQERLISWFYSGDTLRGRRVSDTVLSGVVDVPAPPARLLADWKREISTRLVLEPGDVESMPLARARARWPDYGRCVQAAAAWTGAQGLPGLLAASDVALMACRGARFHHDGEQYGSAAFCNLFMSEDRGLDVLFPATGHRIPLHRGTVLVFDTCQPHGVVPRGRDRFDEVDFASDQNNVQLFLTWELPIEDPLVAQTLQIQFDVPSPPAPQQEQVCINGEPAVVCPHSGRWRQRLAP
ncbi:hypothetical protein [Bordetella sp. N]|uniref:hypothetical protein n=1 Tax=Bordetella sp. N TaxID=1746199 RepID=UPI00070C1068|nr:hypothetical protein [Bordetella sp. N]ALM83927.1 hypothetical protein ASB57_13950 [Bordetella sp. N]